MDDRIKQAIRLIRGGTTSFQVGRDLANEVERLNKLLVNRRESVLLSIRCSDCGKISDRKGAEATERMAEASKAMVEADRFDEENGCL